MSDDSIQFKFIPRWKEDLVCSSAQGSIIADQVTPFRPPVSVAPFGSPEWNPWICIARNDNGQCSINGDLYTKLLGTSKHQI